ncbi:putative toxin-antitoxin system toxin component, PIN family [Patescibacteria group bacterium]|nr:putative toxin-antitoxin system toxin component, PIN family [Patescibacteria group bacterium]
MRVFFDASVIIAALLSTTGGSALLLKYIKAGKIIGITSQTAINEVLEEDKTKKLKKSKAEIENFIARSMLAVREEITPEEIEPYRKSVDVKDAHLIAGATLTKCAYLVSLDKKHLVREDVKRKFLPLKIVSPKELIEEILLRFVV